MILYGPERVYLSFAMKVNFIVKQNEYEVCFSIMHLLQAAVHKISMVTHMCCRACKPQKSYIFATVAVILHFVLMM
jgi:hypothetical protein